MRLAVAANCLLLAISGMAQDRRPPSVPTVTARGEATVNVSPDEVRIYIGVTTQAVSAEEAAAQNAKRASEVVAALKRSLGEQATIQTSGYSIHPNYLHKRDGGSPTISGYTANNTVHIRSSDVANIGKVIDSATRVGANNIHGIHFTLKNEQSARSQTLREAARNARMNAEAMAAGFGMKLGRIVEVTDSEPSRVYPVMRREMAVQADAVGSSPTTIEPGGVQVRAVVTITAELTQQ